MVFPVLVRLLYPSRLTAFWVAGIVALFVIFNHRSNIRRLLAGTEARFRHGRRGAS
jgi:glycerol-3-phosphate acyltransferase PlsY